MEPAANDAAMQDLLAQIWQRNLPILLDRLDTLDAAAAFAQSGAIPPEVLALASANAHKLAGSLGMFGYSRGTDLARELEQLLEPTASLDAQRLTQLAEQLRAELTSTP
jgi:HPt (histidine-containing phosphotransfer) domain-containing protein